MIWGLICSGVAVGAYLLARSVRRVWVGLLVGCVPFVVALYFFFQNVNRLLPAAIEGAPPKNWRSIRSAMCSKCDAHRHALEQWFASAFVNPDESSSDPGRTLRDAPGVVVALPRPWGT